MTTELLSLLSLSIPEPSSNPDGFLEIAGIAHYENVNSRIYAHFLNLRQYPAIRRCFLDALLELIEEKSGKQLDMQEFNVLLEDPTNKRLRIDLLIKDEINKTAIIIENKIYHFLNNDLRNYWDHVPYTADKKVGVLLTLNPHPANDPLFIPEFINVTHSEWIGRIRQNGLPMGIPANYYQYINDFANTIDRLTKYYTMNEQAKFYFQHAHKVIQAKNTMDEAYAFLEDQMDVLAGKLGWKKYGSAFNWKNLWDEKNNIDTYFTIYYDPIINGELKFKIIIELMRDDKNKMSELLPILEGNAQYKLMYQGESKGNYIHFGVRDYTLTMEELEHFGEHVYELIQRDFADTIVAIIKHYYAEEKMVEWLPNFLVTAQ